ncbi:MAG: PIN domain-containing protein [Candidatus Omnitrophica bacterium]|nr:PIN domain-containing protein [Candidatus Omnitrophota bacterium]
MIFIDSWVLIEFFSEGKKFKKARSIMEKIEAGEKAIISTMVLTEIKYRIAKKYSIRKSDEVVHEILTFPNVKILPISVDVAILAANLKIKYYDKEKRPLSFADVINLATAIISKCNVFYSGDSDFKNIKEIKTVIL